MSAQVIYFLLLPDVLLIDLAGAADCFLFANRQAGKTLFELRFISPVAQPVSSLGLRFNEISALPPSLPEQAWLILPGTLCQRFDPNTAAAKQTLSWLRQNITAQQRLICICAGALIAAHAGLLSHKTATTHHDHLAELASIDSSIHVAANRIFTDDGQFASSAGVTAGIDLCLHLINQTQGPALTLAVARAMLIYFRRGSHDSQLSPWLSHRNHMHKLVHKVQDMLSQDPAQDWQIGQIASQAGSSSRHLNRLFKEHAHITVHDYLTSLRLTLAGQFLQQTNWSIERIAEAAGFGSARQFRRLWQSTFHQAPSDSKLLAETL